ncbi:ribonuclease H-like protein [Earliella scabrosa]|nr:ribonuclease H-like protein [Earliella scabrosa]
MNNGAANASAGAGIWFGPNDLRNKAVRVPGKNQTNQAAEIYAVAVAAATVPPFAPLHLVTDSTHVMDGLTKHVNEWEARGWTGIKNGPLFAEATARLRARSAQTTLRWVKGHNGDVGNEGADKLAKIGTAQNEDEGRIPPAPWEYLRRGIKLTEMTQRLAYRRIKMTEKGEQRRATTLTVDRVLATLESDLKLYLDPPSLWKAIRGNLVARRIRDFMWKATHDALRVGKFWENIPGYETRATCGVCGTLETVEHILTECEAPGQREVWTMVKKALALKGAPNFPLTYGTILGSPAITLAKLREKENKPLDRLCKILIPEAAHFIWKIRCERVIRDGNDPTKRLTEKAIRARWTSAMQRRAQLDWVEANRKLRKKPTAAVTILDTWRGIEWNGGRTNSRVLVGTPEATTGVG